MTSYLPRSNPGPVDRVVTENDLTPGNELRRAGQIRRNSRCRQRGTAGQYAAAGEILTGRENHELIGRLYQLGPGERGSRPGGQFQPGRRPRPAVRTNSGGTQRRPCPHEQIAVISTQK